MDIVGPISPILSKRNKLCLNMIDMLTGSPMAVAIPNKAAETVVKANMDHVYSIFRGSSRILRVNSEIIWLLIW